MASNPAFIPDMAETLHGAELTFDRETVSPWPRRVRHLVFRRRVRLRHDTSDPEFDGLRKVQPSICLPSLQRLGVYAITSGDHFLRKQLFGHAANMATVHRVAQRLDGFKWNFRLTCVFCRNWSGVHPCPPTSRSPPTLARTPPCRGSLFFLKGPKSRRSSYGLLSRCTSSTSSNQSDGTSASANALHITKDFFPHVSSRTHR